MLGQSAAHPAFARNAVARLAFGVNVRTFNNRPRELLVVTFAVTFTFFLPLLTDWLLTQRAYEWQYLAAANRLIGPVSSVIFRAYFSPLNLSTWRGGG